MWKKGLKDYYSGKKRISVYISPENEKLWLDFIKNHEITSFSKLIRESVNFYISESTKLLGKNFGEFVTMLILTSH